MEGDLNTDLGNTENDRRGSEIAAAMTEAGFRYSATIRAVPLGLSPQRCEYPLYRLSVVGGEVTYDDVP